MELGSRSQTSLRLDSIRGDQRLRKQPIVRTPFPRHMTRSSRRVQTAVPVRKRQPIAMGKPVGLFPRAEETHGVEDFNLSMLWRGHAHIPPMAIGQGQLRNPPDGAFSTRTELPNFHLRRVNCRSSQHNFANMSFPAEIEGRSRLLLARSSLCAVESLICHCLI